MRDQNWRNTMDDCKSKVTLRLPISFVCLLDFCRSQVQGLIRCAQLQQHNEDDRSRYHHALETLLSAEKEAKQLIHDVTASIADHDAKGDILKKEAAALREARMQPSNDGQDDSSFGKGKGKERQSLTPIPAREDTEDGDLPHTPAGEEHTIKRRSLQQRLRECHVTLHRVKFLQGDVYHILGASHSPAEDAAYEAAEEIRHDLLKSKSMSIVGHYIPLTLCLGTEDDAKHAMAQLVRDATTKGITEKALIIPVPYLDRGGIRSADLVRILNSRFIITVLTIFRQMDEANGIIEEILNEQSALLWAWRSHINTLLTQKLSPGEDEADGQEYQRTLDNQGEAETYLQAYTALLADRREALVNERTLLAAHDAREKKLRHTKAAIKAAAAAVEAQLEIPDDVELQPEHEVLHKELSEQRKDLLQQLNGRAIKSVSW